MNNGYSICFNKWALDKKIKNELRLLVIISSLTAENGYCFASNKYFSKIFDETEISISNKIKKLEKNNYIEIEYEKRGATIINRKIRLKNILINDYKKFKPTIKKIFKDNNTSINNNKLNEFNLYNNFDENEQCECITKSTNQRCMRKSSFNINGKNYCNQHARDLIPDLKIKTGFKKPTLEEVKEYCKERNNNVDAEQFIDFYESKGWLVGKNKMKDWKASVRTWERNKTTQPKESRYEREKRIMKEWLEKDE